MSLNWFRQTLELVKPKHRLQRLFHSLQPGDAVTSTSNGKLASTSQVINEQELAELKLLVNLLPRRWQLPLLDRPDLSSVSASV